MKDIIKTPSPYYISSELFVLRKDIACPQMEQNRDNMSIIRSFYWLTSSSSYSNI